MAAPDELLADWQQQLDEIQALEAIYGSDFRLLEASGLASSTCCTDEAAAAAAAAAGGAGQEGQLAQQQAQQAQQALDAATLALLGPPPCCSADSGAASSSGGGDGGGGGAGWAVDCSLLVNIEPPGGSLRLVLPTEPGGGEAGGSAAAAAEDGEAASSSAPAADAAAAAGAGAAAAAGNEPAAGRQSGGGYSVRYLPPLCLQLRFAPGYPSAQPPEVGLSALWLGAAQAADLERQLETLWQEQGPGAPIVYSWADWLQASALAHLGAADALQLAGQPSSSSGGGGGADADEADAAADGGADEAGGDAPGSAEDVLLKLLRYDALREHQAFQEGLHTCGVCMEEQRGAAFVRLDCRHAWCQGCLAQQAAIHVAEGSLELLRCPDPKCGAALPPAVLRRLLPPAEFERWEALTLQRTLDTMPDAAYCPRCGTVSLEDSDSCAQCPKCFFVFCSLCMEAWHPGAQCVSAETKLAMLRRKMAGGGRAAVEQLRRQEQELLSVAQIEKMAKRCPRCSMATQKAEGCNKMSCGGCGAYWCWRCGKEIEGYKHFRSGECILFDEAEILRWEAEWEEMQAAARVMAAGLRNELIGETAVRQGRAPRGCFCPQCGQVNHKVGNNNHMQCWSCTSHFCYACRCLLRGRGGTHFGPKGCKQHSAD